MKTTFLTTLLTMICTLPTFGFSLVDVLNLPGKTDKPREATEAASGSASESAIGAAAESAIGDQQGISDVDAFLKGIADQTQTNPGGSEARNPASPSKARATGGGCQKNEQGEIVC